MYNTGWQTTGQTEIDKIKSQYGPKTSAPATSSAMPGLPPPTGVAGPTGSADTASESSGWIPWQAPAVDAETEDPNDHTAGAAGSTGFPDFGAPDAAQNATQRWQTNSTQRYYTRMAGTSQRGADRVGRMMARRITPGPNNIPGYGTPSARNNTPSPVKFNNSPSDWTAY